MFLKASPHAAATVEREGQTGLGHAGEDGSEGVESAALAALVTDEGDNPARQAGVHPISVWPILLR